MTRLRPLIDATLDNIADLGVVEALTGPVARGDAETISRQIEATTSVGCGTAKRDTTPVIDRASIVPAASSSAISPATAGVRRKARAVDTGLTSSARAPAP